MKSRSMERVAPTLRGAREHVHRGGDVTSSLHCARATIHCGVATFFGSGDRAFNPALRHLFVRVERLL
jgi:hypothetical protein